ncbi:hypothetical protein K438DRAFT_1770314 [Mycena galopus ATCC 62051]|nr:hypothetical protein K438DRAFT_1770314 [Mycena galopus ATCC 62051]
MKCATSVLFSTSLVASAVAHGWVGTLTIAAGKAYKGNQPLEQIASDLVRFPRAYQANDKGILIDVYNMKGAYQFPGPPVATLIEDGSPPNSPCPHSSSSAHLNTTSTSHTSDHMHLMTHGVMESTTNTAAEAAATKTCKGKHTRSPEALSAAPDMEGRHHRSRVHHGRPVGTHSL